MKSAKRFYKGTANWGDKFRMWRKGQIGLGGIFGKSGTDASGTMAGTKGWRSWLKMPQNTGVGKWANKNWTRWQSGVKDTTCLLYTSPSPRDRTRSRMPSSA